MSRKTSWNSIVLLLEFRLVLKVWLGRGTRFRMPLFPPMTLVTLWVELPGPLPQWNIIRFLFLRWLSALLLVKQPFLLPLMATIVRCRLLQFVAKWARLPMTLSLIGP